MVSTSSTSTAFVLEPFPLLHELPFVAFILVFFAVFGGLVAVVFVFGFDGFEIGKHLLEEGVELGHLGGDVGFVFEDPGVFLGEDVFVEFVVFDHFADPFVLLHESFDSEFRLLEDSSNLPLQALLSRSSS
jgi:hypothetical protein